MSGRKPVQDALIPDEVTPDMLVTLLPSAQAVLKASAKYLAAGLAMETMLSKPLKSREIVMLADLRAAFTNTEEES